MWSRFSSIKSYEGVEMDMRVLLSHKLIQGNTHVAARVNGIYSDIKQFYASNPYFCLNVS